MVTEQTKLKPLIENYLVSYRDVEFIETFLIPYPWYANDSHFNSDPGPPNTVME